MGTFPPFSDVDVHQFCVEEALMERLDLEEARLKQEALLAQRVADAERRAAERVGMKVDG